jgi:hypothetical protein
VELGPNRGRPPVTQVLRRIRVGERDPRRVPAGAPARNSRIEHVIDSSAPTRRAEVVEKFHTCRRQSRASLPRRPRSTWLTGDSLRWFADLSSKPDVTTSDDS